jgi:hypothetical protein
VIELTLDEALAMIDAGTIDDGKTVILLQWAAMQRAAGSIAGPVGSAA